MRQPGFWVTTIRERFEERRRVSALKEAIRHRLETEDYTPRLSCRPPVRYRIHIIDDSWWKLPTVGYKPVYRHKLHTYHTSDGQEVWQ